MTRPISLVVFCSITLYVILFFFVRSYAGEPEKTGLSGHIMVGGAYTRGEPSLDDANTDKNRQILSLAQDSNSLSEASLVVIGGLSYAFESTGTIISIGSCSGTGALSVTQPVDGMGAFTLGLNYQKDEVWQDPFVTGAARAKTDRETKGFILSWDDIMNSGLSFSYGYDDIEIDHDGAGNRNQSLKRDGRHHSFRAGSLLFETDTHGLSAGLVYERMDLSGKSLSFDAYGLEFVHALKAGGWDLESGISVLIRDFDATHPEFGKTRDDAVLALQSAYTYHEPFGFRNYFVTLFGSYELTDSNIRFYDTSLLTLGAGVGYSF